MAIKKTRKYVRKSPKVVYAMTIAKRSLTLAEIEKAKKDFADQGIELICVEYNCNFPHPSIERVQNS